MSKEVENTIYRVSPEVAEILRCIAQKRRFTEAMVLETLVLKEALAQGLIGVDHPEIAFGQLVETIEAWNLPPDPDFTLQVFEKIGSDPVALGLWERAVTPQADQRAEKRKQFVNQRLGRFCKRFIGWESAEEIQLGKGSVPLIQSYTRLKPRD